MSAPKEWSTYNVLLQQLVDRGMDIGDRGFALASIKRVGYYRLSGYFYPFRIIDASGIALDQFIDGTSLMEVMSLYRFDEKLRSILLDGLQVIETAFGAHIAHALGKLDPLAHLDSSFLDTFRCNQLESRAGDGEPRTEYEAWRGRFAVLTPKPEHEDYVRHHSKEYEGQIPLWAAVQFLDFGALLRLFRLMRAEERNSVSSQMGLRKKSPDVLHTWLLSMSTLRNHCAHGNRVWNRSVYRPLAKPTKVFVGAELHHIHDLSEAKLGRVYPLLAHMAYVISFIHPDSDWPNSVRTQVKKLQRQTRFSAETSMGFPTGWEHLSLWGGNSIQVAI
jgi:abortive infection bacteriophage resistance protein